MSHSDIGDLCIDLAPVTLPAFSGPFRRSYWLDYKAIARDSRDDIQVWPVLRGRTYGTTGGKPDEAIAIDCHFDLAEFDSEKYGLVYGDGRFLAELNAHLRSVLGCPDESVCYTEQGMQGDDFISLEATARLLTHFRTLSAHALAGYMGNPEIQEMSFRGAHKTG